MLGAWYFSDFNQICIFSINCNESNQYKLYEILSRAAYLFHAEGRINVKKLIVAFHTFGNAYKKEIHQRHSTPPTPPKSLPRIPMPVGKERKGREMVARHHYRLLIVDRSSYSQH
jgi:hypothetical protein